MIDGEHRWRALQALIDEGLPPAANDELRRLVNERRVPAVVLADVPDAYAKRLTVILNETRGEPDESKLARLLKELEERDSDSKSSDKAN